MREIQLPQANWNGTSRSVLFNQYLDAIRGIEAAMELINKTAPHGRDYQTLEAGAYERAAEEHRERMLTLHHVAEELHALAESVQP